MARISYEDFKKKVMNPNIPDSEIAKYLTAEAGTRGPFDPIVKPDPDKVAITREGQFDTENAMRWANDACRWRRHARFDNRIAAGEKKPVLVSEGDSWFQFPFLIDDVIDQLESDYLIWSLDAAGDTADNMVNRKPEYKKGLDEQKANGVAGFLFSGAGNDVIGQDSLGNPVLASLVKPYRAGKDAAWHIDNGQLAAVLTRLEADYGKVIATIRADADFKKLPIIFHGYDYAIPGGYDGDERDPIYAKQDHWLGAPLVGKGIVDLKLQRTIIRLLIDALYDMLNRVAGKSSATKVYVVNVRGTLKDGDWADEIHATSEAFARVADKFRKTLTTALK